MLKQRDTISLCTGTWMQKELFIDKISSEKNIPKNVIDKQVNSLIKNQEIGIIYLTGHQYINFDSVMKNYFDN